MLNQIEKREKALEEVNAQLAQSEKRALAATQAQNAFLPSSSHQLGDACKFTEQGIIQLAVRRICSQELRRLMAFGDQDTAPTPHAPRTTDSEPSTTDPAAHATSHPAIRFSVSDTGIGMTEEQMGRLF